MRLAMRIGALFYALSYAHSLRRGARSMRIARASKGGAPEGGVPRWYRAPAFLSSFLFLPAARPTDSRPWTRPRRAGGRRTLGDPFSRPRGIEEAGLRAAAPDPGRPGRGRGLGWLEAHLGTRPAFR